MKQRSRPLATLVGLVVAALLVVGYLTLAPTSVGGKTIIGFTYGTSMLPKLHKGDMVVVRTGGSVKVGDAVLYDNKDLERHVLHRVIGIHRDRYEIKGDNNAFVDTYQPTRSEILGKLWFKVGGVGKVSGWLAQPTHAAILTGVVALISLLGSGLKADRKRRKRRGVTEQGAPAARHARAHPVGIVPGHTAQVAGGVLGVIALVCALLAAVSFTRSTTKLGDGPALYTQQGSFTYEAEVPSGAVYENGRLVTGQPAYVQVVRSIRFTFAYMLETQAKHNAFGTTRLVAEMANGSGWTRTFPLAAVAPFAGDRVKVTGILQLAELRKIANRLEAVTGQVPDTYTITIRPTVHLSGQIAGKPLKDEFAPPLALALDRYKLTLPSTGAADTTMQRSQDGPATRTIVPRNISVIGAKLQVQTARRLSTVVGLISLAGALGIGLLFLLRLRKADEPARIRARFGHLIVEIAEPRRRFPEHDVMMASFEDLVRVSDRHARMILHAHQGDRHLYLVEDDGVAYRFEVQGRPSGEGRAPTVLDGGPPGDDSPGDGGGDSLGAPPAERSPAQR